MAGTGRRRGTSVLVKRHSAATRLTHWINALALAVLLMSGLQIFNAHPALYWGHKSTFAAPWIAMTAAERDGRSVGLTRLGPITLETTGVLGYSGPPGARAARGFPAWATIPSYRSLADGRNWHFFFAWLLVGNGAVYLAVSLLSGHLARDLWPRREQLKLAHIAHEIATHARLQFPRGEAARSYNVLQKASYLAVILVLLPLMVATGLAMSPGLDAGAPWLVDLFGGRQSARTVHFLCAFTLVAFVAVHLVMVVASGTWNNVRSMITGRYAIEVEGERP